MKITKDQLVAHFHAGHSASDCEGGMAWLEGGNLNERTVTRRRIRALVTEGIVEETVYERWPNGRPRVVTWRAK